MSSEELFREAQKYFTAEFKPRAFIAGKSYLAASQKSLDFLDFKSLLEATLDFSLTTGRFTKKFERSLSEFVGVPNSALFVNSGSSANLLALSSLVKKADEVITVAASFPTTVNPILQNGAIPVFVDVSFETLNATLESIITAKTLKTRGLILAHTLGNPFEADKISKWCSENDLFLIEDCCDALGAKLAKRNVGTFGDMATFSFYPAHHITTGEGGALLTKTSQLRKKAASLRDWGRDCWCEPGRDNTCNKRFEWQKGELPFGYDHKYIYSEIGYNLKATDLQAAIGVSQLEKLPEFLVRRQENYDYLLNGIMSSPKLSLNFKPISPTANSQPSWFGFGLHCLQKNRRLQITKFLEEKRIGSRLVFGGNLTKQPAYKNAPFKIAEDLKNTDRIMNETFWIGIHPNLSRPELTYMLEQLENAVR